MPEPSLVKVDTATKKLKIYKSPATDQIAAELLKSQGEILCPEKHKLICSVWNKEELPQRWKEYSTLPFQEKIDKNDSNN
jgi:hypothetical protein